MPLHKDLTEADLHELKGASTATEFTVPISDGAGSHSWGLITSDSLDSSVAIGKWYFTHMVTDPVTSQNNYIYVPFDCTVDAVYGVIQAPPVGGAAIWDIRRSHSGSFDTMCTLTWGTGVANGEVKSDVTLVDNTFVAGDLINFNNASSAAASGATRIFFTIVCTLS